MDATSATGLTMLKQAQIQRAMQIAAVRPPGDLSLSMTTLIDEAATAATQDGVGKAVDRLA